MVPHYTVQYIAKLVRKGVRQEERRGKKKRDPIKQGCVGPTLFLPQKGIEST